jgi:hypothetical protein
MKYSVKGLILAAGTLAFLSLPPFVSAQTQPDLELTKPRLRGRVEFNPYRTAAKSGRVDDDFLDERKPSREELARVTTPTMIGEAEVTAFNKGTRAIKAITWEHVYYSDTGMAKVLAAFWFYSKVKIRPGDTKLVRARASVSNLRSRYQKVRLLGIEYADGSVWQSP